MRRKLTLDDLRVESFETTAPELGRGTVRGAETDMIISCGSGCGVECSNGPSCNGCGTGGTGGTANTEEDCHGPSDDPCTWYQVFTCETNQIAYPTQCTGCQFGDCNPTHEYC